MEKRTLIRNRTQISVACSSLTSNSPAYVLEGTMLNCSCGGICIELNQRLQEGTIVMIKAAGLHKKFPPRCPRDFERFRWLKSNGRNRGMMEQSLTI
jgi:hypothetical protein